MGELGGGMRWEAKLRWLDGALLGLTLSNWEDPHQHFASLIFYIETSRGRGTIPPKQVYWHLCNHDVTDLE